MFNQFRISHRLIAMALFSAVFFITAIGIGLHGLNLARDTMKSIHENRSIPMQSLAEIKALMQQNYNETLLAYQHDPQNPQHSLHDHPITEHLSRIQNNKTEIDKLWQSYDQLEKSEADQALSKTFFDNRKIWMTVLLSTGQAFEQGKFETDLMTTFFKAANEDRVAASKAIDQLIAAQIKGTESAYEQAEESHQQAIIAFCILLLIWLIGTTLLFTSTTKHIHQSIIALSDALGSIAGGNFVKPLPHMAHDEIGELLLKVKSMRQALLELILSIRQEIVQLTRSAHELSQSAQNSAQASNHQSQAASTMAAAVEELSASIMEVQNHAIQAGNITQKSANQSQESTKIIDNATHELGQIAIAVNATAMTIQELEDLSEQITSIANVIKSIADQTNLLALNAAIEAARAGEQGRGFSVVADEVRTLAGRTSSSTQEISSMIQRIQQGTERAVKEMNSSVSRVNDGVNLANSAGHSVSDIRNSSQQVALVVNDISHALIEQTQATQEISKRVEQVASGAEHNHIAVAQTAAAAQQIEQIAAQLGQLTHRFKID